MKSRYVENARNIDQGTNNAGLLRATNKKLVDKTIIGKFLASTVVCAIILFVTLNAIALNFHGFSNALPSNQEADVRLSKLRHWVMNSPYETTQSGTWPWWVARAYFVKPIPDIAIMGDSQMNAALIQADAMTMNAHRDCAVDRNCVSLKSDLIKYDSFISTKNLQAVNLSLGGAMPSDYYLMSKSFFSKNNQPKLVVISASPRSFLDATLTSASATETFQFLAPMIDLGNLIDFAFTNPLEKYFWLLRNKFTLYAYQQDIASAVHSLSAKYLPFQQINSKGGISGSGAGQQSLSSIYSGEGFIPVGTNVVGPNARIPFRENMAEYKRRFVRLNETMFASQSVFLKDTLQYLKNIGVQTIVIEMPMLQPVRELLPLSFWQRYHSLLSGACRTQGAHLLDLSESKDFPQDEYIDYVHLNATGGKHFTKKLAIYIKDNCKL